jgi:hypothetical protein
MWRAAWRLDQDKWSNCRDARYAHESTLNREKSAHVAPQSRDFLRPSPSYRSVSTHGMMFHCNMGQSRAWNGSRAKFYRNCNNQPPATDHKRSIYKGPCRLGLPICTLQPTNLAENNDGNNGEEDHSGQDTEEPTHRWLYLLTSLPGNLTFHKRKLKEIQQDCRQQGKTDTYRNVHSPKSSHDRHGK